MADRSYTVRFSRTSIGEDNDSATTLAPHLKKLGDEHGRNLPEREIEGDGWQIRDLVPVGAMWKGVFARLRDDAPHVVDVKDKEHELDLEEGDRILDKLFFLYYSNTNVLVWQANRNVAGQAKLAFYLSQLLETYVDLPPIVDTQALNEVLQRSIHELHFTYARPNTADISETGWKQNAFDMLNSVHGAVGKFVIRAPRHEGLGGQIKSMIRRAVTSAEVDKVRVKLTDETELIDLMAAPIKDRISVPMRGRYPDAARAYEELAEAYGRQSHRFPTSR